MSGKILKLSGTAYDKINHSNSFKNVLIIPKVSKLDRY